MPQKNLNYCLPSSGNECNIKLTFFCGGHPIPIATLSLFRFPDAAARLWVIGQMALARRRLGHTPGVEFYKLCGSGTGEGFTPRPNWQVWAILAAWPDEATARAGLTDGPVWKDWRAHAAEDWSLLMAPIASRGEWAGARPFTPDRSQPTDEPAGPVAILTRATVRPRHALRFWRRVPNISAAIGADPHVLFKIGIGEIPLLHQVTFSVWPDTATMAAFAHAHGPHAQAVRAVRSGDWFAEELYARFRVIGTVGTWDGGDPLARAISNEDAA